jgi:hypothetical protein
MAHARRKFFDLHTHHQSQIAGEALAYFQKLYAFEREVAELDGQGENVLSALIFVRPGKARQSCLGGLFLVFSFVGIQGIYEWAINSLWKHPDTKGCNGSTFIQGLYGQDRQRSRRYKEKP